MNEGKLSLSGLQQKRSFCTLIKNSKLKIKIRFPGDNSGGETPVPIPNTAVKPSCADGTAEFLWKSRTLPGINLFSVLYGLRVTDVSPGFLTLPGLCD
jgi:hypothetical protein